MQNTVQIPYFFFRKLLNILRRITYNFFSVPHFFMIWRIKCVSFKICTRFLFLSSPQYLHSSDAHILFFVECLAYADVKRIRTKSRSARYSSIPSPNHHGEAVLANRDRRDQLRETERRVPSRNAYCLWSSIFSQWNLLSLPRMLRIYSSCSYFSLYRLYSLYYFHSFTHFHLVVF